MGNDNLPALTPVWIIVLASVLAVLVGLGGEIVSRGIYDFLRDFQGAIIGVVAFSIAYWAAKPVYQQLAELRQQSAVQTFEMLQKLATNVRCERIIVDDFRYHAVRALTFEKALITSDFSDVLMRALLLQFKAQQEALERGIDALRATQAHPWGDQNTWVLRTSLETSARLLLARVSKFSSELSDLRMRGLAKSATWHELTTEARQISLDAEVSAVNQAVADYMRAIDVELVRLHPLMERAMKGII
jgi:hypothetical protein